MNEYDIIIIGAGPGGLTAGIYAGRQGTRNLIIDRDLAGGLGREVPEMENYPGFDNISGLELIEKMKAQATKNCDLREMEEVTEITKTDGEYRFTVKTSKDTYQSKAIILATGSSHRHLEAKGEEEFKGKGVSYCATCDGFFFAGILVVAVEAAFECVRHAFDYFLVVLRRNFHGHGIMMKVGYFRVALQASCFDSVCVCVQFFVIHVNLLSLIFII